MMRRRSHSHPSACLSGTSDSVDYEDYATASDVFPVRVPLETVKIGSWRYTANELDDIELLYELESSELLIKTSICGTNGAAPATFRIRDISAADLSLISIVPGSLETMVARLTLETKSEISLDGNPLKYEDKSKSGKSPKELKCRIVTMTASVHESGHLRDTLLFLKCGYPGDSSPENLFLSPKRQSEKEAPKSEPKHRVVFLEGLPFWVLYLPWWFYSRNTRVLIQKVIFIYSIFSVMWASWQLYRHVNVIHIVLEPLMNALRTYLSSLMEILDTTLALFTDWWMKFLSPLNIFSGLLLTPLLQIALQLKGVFAPVLMVITPIFSPVWKCLTNVAILGPIKAMVAGLYNLVVLTGHQLWSLLSLLARPLSYIWQSLLNSRVAVASLDLNKIRITWVYGLVINSLKAIVNGLAKLFGYTRTKQKQIKALRNPPPAVAPTPSPGHGYRPRKMPVYYSSPLTKQQS